MFYAKISAYRFHDLHASLMDLTIYQQSHAAMVFDEAARLSYELRHLWPHASALTPKVPAQFRCHTKCSDPPSSKPANDVSPVLCLKEHLQYITALESEDYSIGIRVRVLKSSDFMFN
jgi:hypothetical protein